MTNWFHRTVKYKIFVAERNHRGNSYRISKKKSFNREYITSSYYIPFHRLEQGFYTSMEYRKVGVFKEQGKIDGHYVSVMAMEKILAM